jgi:multidrug resistance efflux pump
MRIADEFDNAKNNYTEAKQKYTQLSSSAQTSDSAEAAAAKDAMDQALVKVDELRTALDSLEIKAPSKGQIKNCFFANYCLVEAGDHEQLIHVSAEAFETLMGERVQHGHYSE